MYPKDRFDIKVSFARLKTSINALALKSSVKTYNLKSAFSDLTLKAHTELHSLRASIEVGKFPFVPVLIELINPVNFVSEIFFSFTKILEDSVDLSSETVSISVSLNKENTFNTTDTDNVEMVLNKTETSTVSSSGSLVSQNYTVDNTYFLEDYVGSSRLFT